MIPLEMLSVTPVTGDLINPRSGSRGYSFHMGPVSIQDTSKGLLYKMWRARISDNKILLSSGDVDEFVQYTHTHPLREVSLAFDQNANPYFSFTSIAGISYIRWWNPLIPAMETTELDSDVISPRITLDDARRRNIQNSDVILAYIRNGILRYRKQRERWLTEYTPTEGVDGSVVKMDFLSHVSMNSQWRLEFIGGDEDPLSTLVANPDYNQIPNGATKSTNVLANDTYLGNPVTLEVLADLPKIVRSPITGNAVVNPDGSISFTAPRGFQGVISFEYEISTPPEND